MAVFQGLRDFRGILFEKMWYNSNVCCCKQEREEKLIMRKKLIIVWLTLIMVLFSSISIYADEDVQGDFFEKHVIINGNEIINYNLQYPFILHNDTTYFPLTREICEIFGISAEMDWESRTLKLLKTDSTRKNISSNWLKNNNEDLTLNVVSGAKILAFINESETDVITENKADNIATDALSSPELSVTEIDLGGLPVLASGKNLFIPLRVMTSEENFNWDIFFDPFYGICISTNPEVPASTYADKAEILLNKGLVKYMKDANASITNPIGQKYLFLFKRAADVYKVDCKLLMAVASKESHFGVWATSSGGARGMMQIMPATGARYGLTTDDLYDAKTNIDFGTMYISERIAAYGGDWVKGLSAYNQGSSKVNRGTHSTVYADRIMGEYSRINNYLTMNGYTAQ